MRKIHYLAWSSLISVVLHGSGCSAVAAAPALSTVTPPLGPTTGGIELTLDGQHFVTGAAVTVAGIQATQVSVISDTRISVLLPARPGPWEAVPVAVTNPDGQTVSRSDLFGYDAGQLAFTGSIVTAGAGAGAVVVRDFNGDQKLDLAVANGGGDSVSVLLGNGIGGFGAATHFAVGHEPHGLVIADFNTDQKPDLATANSQSNTVSVLLGDGMGGFSASRYFSVGMFPFSVAAGDFNGDHKPDLAIANRNSNDVSVLLGNGMGDFGTATKFTAGMFPIYVAVGDFNGDQKLDLAIANADSNNISLLLGNGMGGFGAPVNFAVGTSPYAIAVDDLNSDQKPDLAVANFKSNSVSVLLGNGMGGFSAATNFSVGTYPLSIAVGDFNGDRKSDLAVLNQNRDDKKASVLLGDGMGGFGTAINFATGGYPNSVAVDDLNRDQKPDLVTANGTNHSATVSILLNQSQ